MAFGERARSRGQISLPFSIFITHIMRDDLYTRTHTNIHTANTLIQAVMPILLKLNASRKRADITYHLTHEHQPLRIQLRPSFNYNKQIHMNIFYSWWNVNWKKKKTTTTLTFAVFTTWVLSIQLCTTFQFAIANTNTINHYNYFSWVQWHWENVLAGLKNVHL